VPGKKTSFLSHLYIKTIFCQDRLRTNIGKTQNRTVFLQGFPGLLDNEELDAMLVQAHTSQSQAHTTQSQQQQQQQQQQHNELSEETSSELAIVVRSVVLSLSWQNLDESIELCD
jgi:restriction endonuclease Mrr